MDSANMPLIFTRTNILINGKYQLHIIPGELKFIINKVGYIEFGSFCVIFKNFRKKNRFGD